MGRWTLVCIVAACTPKPASPRPALDDAALFGQKCLDCHDGSEPSRPVFSKALDRDNATRAFEAVTRRVMPPDSAFDTSFTLRDRERLISWLCVQTGRSTDICRQTSHTMRCIRGARGALPRS